MASGWDPTIDSVRVFTKDAELVNGSLDGGAEAWAAIPLDR